MQVLKDEPRGKDKAVGKTEVSGKRVRGNNRKAIEKSNDKFGESCRIEELEKHLPGLNNRYPISKNSEGLSALDALLFLKLVWKIYPEELKDLEFSEDEKINTVLQKVLAKLDDTHEIDTETEELVELASIGENNPEYTCFVFCIGTIMQLEPYVRPVFFEKMFWWLKNYVELCNDINYTSMNFFESVEMSFMQEEDLDNLDSMFTSVLELHQAFTSRKKKHVKGKLTRGEQKIMDQLSRITEDYMCGFGLVKMSDAKFYSEAIRDQGGDDFDHQLDTFLIDSYYRGFMYSDYDNDPDDNSYFTHDLLRHLDNDIGNCYVYKGMYLEKRTDLNKKVRIVNKDLLKNYISYIDNFYGVQSKLIRLWRLKESQKLK